MEGEAGDTGLLELKVCPVRISIVLPNLQLSGGVKMAVFYADALTSRGHDVTVVCAATPKPPLRRRMRRLAGSFIRGASQPKPEQPWTPKDAKLLMSARHGEDIVPDLPDADILIATWWETAEAVWPAPDEKGRKVYFVQDHEVFPYLPFERSSSTYRLPFHKIVVSHWLGRVMNEIYGDDRVSLVPNPVAERHLFNGARTRSDGFVLGSVYSEGPRKNSDMALQAIRLARLRLPDIGFIGFGTCAAPRSILQDSRARYICLPPQDQIPSLYAACDAWLFPSTSEGFGLPILEAMAAGTPVIATKAGAAPELVNEETGILVETTAEDMAYAIIQASAISGERWREMSDSCRRMAAAYDETSSTNAFEKILTDVAERRSEDHIAFQS